MAQDGSQGFDFSAFAAARKGEASKYELLGRMEGPPLVERLMPVENGFAEDAAIGQSVQDAPLSMTGEGPALRALGSSPVRLPSAITPAKPEGSCSSCGGGSIQHKPLLSREGGRGVKDDVMLAEVSSDFTEIAPDQGSDFDALQSADSMSRERSAFDSRSGSEVAPLPSLGSDYNLSLGSGFDSSLGLQIPLPEGAIRPERGSLASKLGMSFAFPGLQLGPFLNTKTPMGLPTQVEFQEGEVDDGIDPDGPAPIPNDDLDPRYPNIDPSDLPVDPPPSLDGLDWMAHRRPIVVGGIVRARERWREGSTSLGELIEITRKPVESIPCGEFALFSAELVVEEEIDSECNAWLLCSENLVGPTELMHLSAADCQKHIHYAEQYAAYLAEIMTLQADLAKVIAEHREGSYSIPAYLLLQKIGELNVKMQLIAEVFRDLCYAQHLSHSLYDTFDEAIEGAERIMEGFEKAYAQHPFCAATESWPDALPVRVPTKANFDRAAAIKFKDSPTCDSPCEVRRVQALEPVKYYTEVVCRTRGPRLEQIIDMYGKAMALVYYNASIVIRHVAEDAIVKVECQKHRREETK